MPAVSPCAIRTSASRKKPMISSVDFPFRAISTSPAETSEIAGFAPHTWYRIREADHLILEEQTQALASMRTLKFFQELRGSF